MDCRITGEILLRHYEELVRLSRAEPLPKAPPRTYGPFDFRLKRRRPLDALLTEFGLSPHPRLVLVVEGETERRLFPRVMAILGLRGDEDFLSIQNAAGVGRELAPLTTYAAAPRVAPEEHESYVELLRPATRLLIVFDPEGSFATAEGTRRAADTGQIFCSTLCQGNLRHGHVREQLRPLVNVVTWRRSGESFEFAHFTNRQIAQAMQSLDSRARQPTFEKRVEIIRRCRQRRGDLAKLLWPGVSKIDLAEALWPTLERKIRRAQEAERCDEFPSCASFCWPSDSPMSFLVATL